MTLLFRGRPRAPRNDVTPLSAPVFVTPPVITKATVGQPVQFTLPVVAGHPAPTFTYEVLIDGVVVGDETYELDEADNLDDVQVRATATNSEGSATATSAAVQVTYNAPVAAGGLANQTFTDDTGAQTFDPTGDFTVPGDTDLSGVTWSLPTTVAGVTIDPATGEITFDTDALAEQADTPIVVRATNSGDSADSGFTFTINAVVVPTTNFTREFNANTGDEAIDLTGVFAATGPSSYSLQGSPAGVTLNSADLTINTGTASAGSITVRLTDDNGDRDLVLALTLPTLSITHAGGDYYQVNNVANDSDPAKAISSVVTGGEFNGEAVNTTLGALQALGNGDALLVISPVISLTADGDSDGQIDSNDVLTATRLSLKLFNSAFPEPPSSYQWYDASGPISGETGLTYLGTGAENGEVYLEEAAGGDTATSNTIASDAPAAPEAFADADWSVATGAGPNEIVVNIASEPNDNGSPATGAVYDLDGANTWVSIPGYSGPGSYVVTMAAPGTLYALRLRLVNGVGTGDPGNTESATSGAAASPGTSDDFNRANEAVSASADWTAFEVSSGTEGAIVLNEVASVDIGASSSLFVYEAEAPANDQFSEIDLVLNDKSNSNQHRVYLVTRYIDANNYYYVDYQPHNGRIRFRKVVGGSDTQISDTGGATGVTSGTIRFEVSSTTLSVTDPVNGTRTTTDSDLTSGKVGFGFNQNSAALAAGQIVLDNWAGGDV